MDLNTFPHSNFLENEAERKIARCKNVPLEEEHILDLISTLISLRYSPDSEMVGLPADLSELLELPDELVDAVPRELSEMLRRLDSITLAAAAAMALVGATGRPWSAWKPWRPVWFVSCSSRRLRNLCSRDSCSLCMAFLRSRSSKFCNRGNDTWWLYYS